MRVTDERLPKRLYAIKEAAQYMGRTERALREMIWAKKIPIIRDGKKILLDIKDMDAWIETHKENIEVDAA